MISTMECELGYPLFQRRGRGLEPTPEALSLMPYIEDALGKLDKLQQHAASLASGATGTVVIATNFTLFSSVLARAASELRLHYPKINIEVRVLPAPQITEAVLTHQVDLGLTYGPLFNRNLVAETIARGQAVCVFPNSDPLAGSAEVHARRLIGRPIVTFSEHTPIGLAFRRVFENLDLDFSPNLILGNTPSVLDMVTRGSGVGLVDHFESFANEYPSLSWSPFIPRIEISTVLIRLRSSPMTLPLVDFIEKIESAANSNDR